MATATVCFRMLSSEEEAEQAVCPKPRKVSAETAVDTAARQRLLEKCVRKAHEKAAKNSTMPLIYGRMALFGLLLLAVIRGLAWWDGNIPGYSVFGMHFLSTTSDIACVAFALPLFIAGTSGQCVQVGCVGPMMTLVFAMTVVDMGALCAFLLVATPRPLSPGARSILDVAEACIGIWDLVLFASVALQLSLLQCCWRVYKELRVNGLYPPGRLPAGMGKIEEASIFELCCEVDDVKFLRECDCRMGPARSAPAAAAASSEPESQV